MDSTIYPIRPDKENSSTGTTAKKYSYHFGMDSINLSNMIIDNDMCFISEDIEIGELGSDEFIQLSSNYNTGDNGSIEFYILDGSEAKSILPIETSIVINERIFYGMRPRFSIDPNESTIVKKHDATIDTTLEQAINSNDSGYTVTYVPLDAYNLKTKNSAIKVKAILRTYNKGGNAPFISNIAIRKYGRSFSWNS